MNKRSFRFELLFSITFLTALIVVVAAFFSGVSYGANKMEAKYKHLKVLPAMNEDATSYQQQDLVTFYHNVFEPYIEFKSAWVAGTEELRSSSTKQGKAILRDLKELAETKYNEVNQHVLYDSSPLLQEAQTGILKSLKLFAQAASESASAQNLNSGEKALEKVKQDPLYQNAVKYGLSAQKDYYSSMLKWANKTNSKLPKSYISQEKLTLKEWNKYTLIVKNVAISDILLKKSLFEAYNPQDLTAKVDYIIHSGNASTMQLNSIQDIVDLLIKTEAVQEQDYLKWNAKYYNTEVLPQLPFFYES